MAGQGIARKMENANSAAPETAIYLLFLRRELVYVGKSRNPDSRINSHRKNGRPFDYAVVVPVARGDMDWIEVALIKAFAPPQNRLGLEGKAGSHISVPEPEPTVVHVHHTPIPPTRSVFPTVMATHKAQFRASRVGLKVAFDEAVIAGDIPFAWANPDRMGHGARKLFRESDVDAWIEKTQAVRFSGAGVP